MNNLSKLLCAAAAAAAVTLSATTASADIVCNSEGDCWHVKARHQYKPEFGVKVYSDDWKWADSDSRRYRWREHDGRGYWRNGIWLKF